MLTRNMLCAPTVCWAKNVNFFCFIFIYKRQNSVREMRVAAQLFSCKKFCGSYFFTEKAPAEFWSAELTNS